MNSVIYDHALVQLAKHKIFTKKWFFWRGVLVGMEAERSPEVVSIDWADFISDQDNQ